MVKITGNASPKEAENYVEYLEKKYNRKLESLDIKLDGEYAELNYKFLPVEFSRIRRITGYLVGDMNKWNNGKAAEESDRVKHSLNGNMELFREQEN